MGCQADVVIGANLTFSICCHDPDTGVLTDADSAPTWRLYEDETATPILNGTMAELDTGNTTGFYTEQIACTAANGFESGKSYTIYIEATVDSDTGGISYGFTVKPVLTATTINDELLDVLATDEQSLPGQGSPTQTPTLATAIMYLYKIFRNKVTQSSDTLALYADDGVTIDQKATVTDDGSLFTRGEFESGP